MAVVVNVNSIKRRLDQLNWPFQLAEVAQFLQNQSIPSGEFVAYLDACIASGDGVDDAAVQGCSPANGAKISQALRQRGVML